MGISSPAELMDRVLGGRSERGLRLTQDGKVRERRLLDDLRSSAKAIAQEEETITLPAATWD